VVRDAAGVEKSDGSASDLLKGLEPSGA